MFVGIEWKGLKPSSYYSSSQFSEKSSQQSNNGADFPLAEPPLEYSTPAEAELPRKNLSENVADVKRGILSSLLEKVSIKIGFEGSPVKSFKSYMFKVRNA